MWQHKGPVALLKQAAALMPCQYTATAAVNDLPNIFFTVNIRPTSYKDRFSTISVVYLGPL